MNNRDQCRSLKVLLIEDNPNDVVLTELAMKKGKLHSNLHRAMNGEEALKFLHNKDKYKNAPRPDIILLDWNLPNIDGREVLENIKEDPELKHIPVVVLTISDAKNDILEAYNLHANCFITKPFNLKQFFNVIKYIRDFWTNIVKLPRDE